MTKEEALENLAQSRQAFQKAIEGLSEEEKTQVQVEGVWTIKDIIGHLSSWEVMFVEPMQGYADRGVFECDVMADYGSYNDKEAARKRDVPLDAILSEAATVRQGLVAAANELSVEQLEAEVALPWGGTGTLSGVLGDLKGHEMEHLGAIQQWRQGDGVTG